jgi:hypothetical protein
MASTGCCGPSIAAMPARCVKVAVQEFELTISLLTASTNHSASRRSPLRQPVMA